MKRSDIASRHHELVDSAECLLGPRVESTWFAIGAAVLTAVGAVYAADKQSDALKYEAKVEKQNAGIARQQASVAEDEQRQRGRIAIGRQLAAGAESGTELTGSNLDLLENSLYDVEVDAMNIRYDGELKAHGLETQAKLNRSQASATMTGGYLSAAGKLLGAASSYTSAGGTVPSSYSYNGGVGTTVAAGINGGR